MPGSGLPRQKRMPSSLKFKKVYLRFYFKYVKIWTNLPVLKSSLLKTLCWFHRSKINDETWVFLRRSLHFAEFILILLSWKMVFGVSGDISTIVLRRNTDNCIRILRTLVCDKNNSKCGHCRRVLEQYATPSFLNDWRKEALWRKQHFV